MQKPVYFVIDFDSTFVKVEALDTLAKIALKGNPQKDHLLQQIKDITDAGMNGQILFDQSLQQRLALFKANKGHIARLISLLKKNITPSIERNQEFFYTYREYIYIISGGFKEYIHPIFKPFGIAEDHILANSFIFDEDGTITDFDHNNLLAQPYGKVKQIKNLDLQGKVYVIGDGYTDYQIKEAGLADKFFVFTENITRDSVVQKADYLLPNFDEFLYKYDLPRAYSFPKNRINVLLLENIHPIASEIFKAEGYSVETLPKALDENQLSNYLRNVSILGVRSKTALSKGVLQSTDKLIAVGVYAIGTNHIDLKTASLQGISVFNAPYSNTRSVVELTIGNIIALYRKVFEKSTMLHRGIWDKSAADCHEIRGKTLGIIGYGNIGSQLSVIAEDLGMKVLFYDIADKLVLGNAEKCSTLEQLLKSADIITVHVDGRPENNHLISKKEFALMKDGVLFLNLSRGNIVDINALASYIKSKKIAGSAIDVYPYEPKQNGESFSSSLQNLPNTILTPHIGAGTVEAQERIGEFVTRKIINYINEGATTLSLSMPNVQVPAMQHAHRLLHIHRNSPGVLAKINSILAKNDINIEGQFLKTNEDIGYVITDVNKKHDKKVIEELKNISETIKLRILY